MDYSITQNGKTLSESKYTIDLENKTFSSKEDNLVLDFSKLDSWTFKTGSNCTFKTDSYCTFITSYTCTFTTGSYCTFKTGPGCTFSTGLHAHHSCRSPASPRPVYDRLHQRTLRL